VGEGAAEAGGTSRRRLYRVSAVVLRQRDLGEADRIVVLYTPHRGKLSAVAKGVKRPRSKLAGGLQLFTQAEILLAVGRTLEVITQVRPVEAYYRLRTDMARFAHASYAVELLDVLTEERAPDPDLFALLVAVLHGLDQESDPATLLRGFELQLLTRLGYGPELETCVSCGTEVEGGRAGFATSEGGVVCARCLGALGLGTISANALRAMRDLVRMTPEQLTRRKLSRAAGEELARIMRPFVDYQLPRRLRSAEFLDGM
jgi:DNA repair protein RecO (recombination protein O)